MAKKIEILNPFTNLPELPDNFGNPENEFLNNLKELQVGIGNKSMRVDRRGMWFGSETPVGASSYVRS